jgi:hypothetical protein
VAVEIRSRVAVLDVDPELGQGLGADQRAIARAAAIATAVTLPPGAWRPTGPCPRAPLSRAIDGTWRLHGAPPNELAA